ncbi:OmpA family protein [Adhaeribacter sp. BT258]|uniref:OmpA family protein n=1 Tax=Adhaeribacter terrigena TaxID=2793070 RepID=A0ABS1C023_9BACT|nr:OmpA family protein [Adhaeribacter terrigena]MBK0402705.1 OmpA family protein [Adhaeribacter terrigena]
MGKSFGFILLMIFGFFGTVLAQSEKVSSNVPRAVLMYQRSMDAAKDRNFDKAIELMENAIKRDPKFGEAYLRMGGYFKLLGNKAKAYENYKKGISLLPFNPALVNDYLVAGDLSMNTGDYLTAEENYSNYLKSSPKNPKLNPYAELQIKNCQFAQKAIQRPVEFKPRRLGTHINQFTYQYFPNVTADQRYFLYTGRGAGTEADENLYISERTPEGEWSNPASVSPLINTVHNEGAGTISGDGKTLVFTSCDRPDSQGDCDLYISVKQGNQWSKPRNLGHIVNSSSWDSQPALSADGRILYFASLRKNGSYGQEDIWVTRLQENGQWSAAVNAGPTINTSGKDMAPFIHASGTTLYFTSDGHVGMGGLDAYETHLTDNVWSTPQNLGYPLNTYEDEGSVFISSNNVKGYYSRQLTNPNSGKRSIDIFEFDVPPAWKSKDATTYAEGRVYDAATKKPIKADLQLYDISTDELEQQVSSDQVTGEYTIVLKEGGQYAMYASSEGYLLKSMSFDYTNKKDFNPLMLDIYLDPVRSGSSIVLNNIFFPTGEFNLDPKSKTELKKLVTFMNRNATIIVEISGHTDDVGSDANNQVLSQKRAQSVTTFLTSNGVSKNRIKAIGYGETKPAVPNNTDANRQQNRRIEFRILSE